jgi:hypothetical protein
VGLSAKIYSLVGKSSIAGIFTGASRRLPEEAIRIKPQANIEIRLRAER